jgi:PAS domain S-box-containing protein
MGTRIQEKEKTKAQLIVEVDGLKQEIRKLEDQLNAVIASDERREALTNFQKLQALFENVDVLLWSVREEPDGELYYEKVNDIFASVSGLKPSDYDGRPVRELGTEEELQHIRNSLEHAKKNRIYAYDKVFGKEPNQRTFIIRIISLPPSEGVYHYIGSAVDITDRMKSEEAIERERNIAQTYLDIAGVMLLVIGDDQRVKLINKKGCEILACCEDEILGSNWFDRFVPKKIREDIRSRFISLMNGEIPQEYFENAIQTKLGVEKIILWHNTILKDESAKPVGLLGSGEDITHRKRVERELQRHTNTLEVLYELSTQMSASVDLDDLLEKTTSLMAKNPGVLAGAVYLVDESKTAMQLRKSFGEMSFFFNSARSLSLTHPFVNSVLKSDGVFGEILFDKKEMDKEIGHRVSTVLRMDDSLLGLFSMILREVDDYTMDFFGLIGSEIERSIARKISEQELLSTKQMLEKITFASPTFIGLLDIPSGKMLFTNHSVLESLGYPPDEVSAISSMSYSEKRYMYHPDDQENLDKFVENLLSLKDC